MSKKANLLLVAAAAALGITITVGAAPISEALLNDYTVKGVSIAQVDDSGRCVVIVTVQNGAGDEQVRAVASASGDVRVYSDFGATAGLIKRSKLSETAVVTYKRKLKEANVGDPVASLKALYKSFKSEKATANNAKVMIASDITAAVAQGWDTASGTPEAVEFADYLKKQATVTEWYDYATARVTALAAALVAAGIDPVTVV
jgi:hypothetical protein